MISFLYFTVAHGSFSHDNEPIVQFCASPSHTSTFRHSVPDCSFRPTVVHGTTFFNDCSFINSTIDHTPFPWFSKFSLYSTSSTFFPSARFFITNCLSCITIYYSLFESAFPPQSNQKLPIQISFLHIRRLFLHSSSISSCNFFVLPPTPQFTHFSLPCLEDEIFLIITHLLSTAFLYLSTQPFNLVRQPLVFESFSILSPLNTTTQNPSVFPHFVLHLPAALLFPTTQIFILRHVSTNNINYPFATSFYSFIQQFSNTTFHLFFTLTTRLS